MIFRCDKSHFFDDSMSTSLLFTLIDALNRSSDCLLLLLESSIHYEGIWISSWLSLHFLSYLLLFVNLGLLLLGRKWFIRILSQNLLLMGMTEGVSSCIFTFTLGRIQPRGVQVIVRCHLSKLHNCLGLVHKGRWDVIRWDLVDLGRW